MLGNLTLGGVLTFILYLPYNWILGKVTRELLSAFGTVMDQSLSDTAKLTVSGSSSLLVKILTSISWEHVLPLLPAVITAVGIMTWLQKRTSPF